MATSTLQHIGGGDHQELPTKWVAPKKPPYRESILDHEDIKAAILIHNKQPSLNRTETERLKNPFKKQLCVEMLKQGFHKSFRELDLILKLQIEERHRLGSEHPVWEKPLLDQEDTKLEYLCKKLNKAEAGERAHDYKTVYSSYSDLANYFILTDDAWLADYFFDKCLNIVHKTDAKLDPKRQAEAECNLGFSFEKKTDDYTAKSDRIRDSYFNALEHYQKYYDLTKDNKNWMLSPQLDDLTKEEIDKLKKVKHSMIEPELAHIYYNFMFADACMHLQRVYKIIASRYARDNQEKIDYLNRVYQVCESSEIKDLEGQASYLLGQAYDESGDLNKALEYYKKYYDISKEDKDSQDYGKSAEALAKCHQRLGQIDKSIEYLEKYLSDSSSSGNNRAQYSRVCSTLAFIYNSLGNYDQAAEYSRKAFEASQSANEEEKSASSTSASEYNRVLYGISRAHKNLPLFSKNIAIHSRLTIQNLLSWKYDPKRELVLTNLSEQQ